MSQDYRITQNVVTHYYRIETWYADNQLWEPGSEFSTYKAAADIIKAIKKYGEAKAAEWVPVDENSAFVHPALVV